MKTRYFAKALRIALLWGVAANLAAQEEQTGSALNRELTLEREYNPSVQDANKVNTLPAVKEPAVVQTPVDYAMLSLPLDPEREIGLLPAAHILSDMEYSKRRSYASLGVGTYLNLDADAGFHILSTAKDRLNLLFSHRSTRGNVKYMDGFMKDGNVMAKLNDNLGGLYYLHEFDRATLRLGAAGGYSAFNYYGLPAPGIHSTPGPVADTQTNQQTSRLTLNAGIESRETVKAGYALDFGYTGFSYKYAWDNSMKGIAEHSASVRGQLYTTPEADRRIGLAARFDYFFYTLPPLSAATFDNYLEGTLTPYYQIEGSLGNLRLGVNLMFVTPEGTNGFRLFASPQAGFDIRLGAKTLLYMNAGGEIHSNSALQLSRENRYVDPYTGVTPSRTWLDAVAGLKTGILPGLWFNVFGEYRITDDDCFFIPYLTPEGFGNLSRVLTANSRLLKGGVELKYTWRKLFDLTLKGVYNRWNEEEDDTSDRMVTPLDFQLIPKRKAYGRPSAELAAGLCVRPSDKLSLALDYYLASGRKTLVHNSNADMKDISELNLAASYTFNDTFAASLKAKNLLFRQYELIYGYPLQGFSIMGGVNINF
jgi:hypothetical protein